MCFEIVSNVKNMTLGRFWSLTDYDIGKSESQILLKERRGRFYTVREQQKLFDEMKPFDLFNSVIRQRIRRNIPDFV